MAQICIFVHSTVPKLTVHASWSLLSVNCVSSNYDLSKMKDHTIAKHFLRVMSLCYYISVRLFDLYHGVSCSHLIVLAFGQIQIFSYQRFCLFKRHWLWALRTTQIWVLFSERPMHFLHPPLVGQSSSSFLHISFQGDMIFAKLKNIPL